VARVLLLGSSGFLGPQIESYLIRSGHSVFSVSRTGASDLQIDVADRETLLDKLPAAPFDIVLNLIALTDVDYCEANPNSAFVSNVRTVENIVSWIMENSPTSHLIHISSDHVYDGPGPHKEDGVSIVNTYGMTKFAGELAAKLIPATILRTNFFGRSHKVGVNGLADWLYSSLVKGERVQVLSDVYFSPVSLATLCEIIERLIALRPVGIYNLGSREGMSKSEFAYKFAELLTLDRELMSTVGSLNAGFHRTKRPKDMRMDSSKLEAVLGFALPRFIDEIRKVADEYR